MTEHQCFEAIAEKWDGPFEKPISWSRGSNIMSAKWMIKVYKLTKEGNISRNGGGYLRIEYCPLCGEKMTDDSRD